MCVSFVALTSNSHTKLISRFNSVQVHKPMWFTLASFCTFFHRFATKEKRVLLMFHRVGFLFPSSPRFHKPPFSVKSSFSQTTFFRQVLFRFASDKSFSVRNPKGFPFYFTIPWPMTPDPPNPHFHHKAMSSTLSFLLDKKRKKKKIQRIFLQRPKPILFFYKGKSHFILFR